METKETIVVSVGGSLMVPDAIDTTFIVSLKTLLETEVRRGKKFVLVVGGGKTARIYQQAARDIAELPREDLDWLGIHATRLNAHLLRTVLRDIAYPVVAHRLDDKIASFDAPIVIGAGVRPGFSSDYVAVHYARTLGAHRLINLSDIDYVYSANPKTDPAATPIPEISWEKFRELIPKKWDPGLSSPFDPVASREAEGVGLEVAIISGHKLEEFKKYLNNEAFIGTRIS